MGGEDKLLWASACRDRDCQLKTHSGKESTGIINREWIEIVIRNQGTDKNPNEMRRN